MCTPLDDDMLFAKTASAQELGARLVCVGRRCTVVTECLADAAPADEGVRGGLTQWARPRSARAPVECGTTAGEARHRRHGEEPCDACKEAKLEYKRALRRRRAA